MGSRLSISLRSLTSQPDITVELYTENLSSEGETPYMQGLAKVTFLGEDETHQVHFFDVDSYEQKTELSTDFNFFRYGPGDKKMLLLRCLYENSICFTVTH